jgi:hypothetical protein
MPDGTKRYHIKVINRSRRAAVDIRAELRLRTEVSVPGGKVITNERMNLKYSEVLQISGYRKKDEKAEYARRFIISDDVDEIWKDETHTHIGFRIYAKDSLSNLGRVFSKDYHTKRYSLVDGSFVFGDSMEVK